MRKTQISRVLICLQTSKMLLLDVPDLTVLTQEDQYRVL